MKKILCILLSLCCFVLSSCSNANSDESKIDGLILEDYIRWGKCYILVWQIEGNPTYYPAALYGKEPGSKLIATDISERLVNLINYYLFDHHFTEDEEIGMFYSYKLNQSIIEQIKKEFKSFGIADDNRLTIDWIVNNPYDSYQLMKKERSFIYAVRDDVINDNDIYIIGKVYNLNEDEYVQYVDTFFIKYNRGHMCRSVSFEAEPLISKLNEYFWSNNLVNQDEEFATSLSIVEGYGLSKDNSMTERWILDNPYEAYHLMNDLPDNVREEIFTVGDEDED